jgi:hypothetical protein
VLPFIAAKNEVSCELRQMLRINDSLLCDLSQTVIDNADTIISSPFDSTVKKLISNYNENMNHIPENIGAVALSLHLRRN